MPDENSLPKIKLDKYIIAYVETLLNGIRQEGGWGTVTIRVSNGRISYIEYSVSEKWNQEERVT